MKLFRSRTCDLSFRLPFYFVEKCAYSLVKQIGGL